MLGEIDDQVRQTTVAICEVRVLEAKVQAVAQQYPQQVVDAGVSVGRLAYDWTGSIGAGIEAGVYAAAFAAAAKSRTNHVRPPSMNGG